jgi:hypothetical protein
LDKDTAREYLKEACFQWEVPEAVSLGQATKGQEGYSAIESLQNHVVMAYSTKEIDGELVERVEATTCGEYIERSWGVVGKQVLDHVATHGISELGVPTPGCKYHD